MAYNDPATATALYNGNISETYWKGNSDNILRKYKYTYDNLNRLTDANYNKPGLSNVDSYREKVTYDKNGNIIALLRNGDMDTNGGMVNKIDDLSYTYDGNQLTKVIDNSNSPQGFKDDSIFGIDLFDDYTYDTNGNMKRDQNKGITGITYNHLNLPTIISFGLSNKIEYTYNALGQKLQKKVTENTNVTNTLYLNGFQYKNDVLLHFPHAEGYVNNIVVGGNNTYNYVFNYTDHLGNIRMSYAKDPATGSIKILEENHYYPFGMKQTNYNSNRNIFVVMNAAARIVARNTTGGMDYNYKFQSQERQDELGLNWDSFKWRNYDYATGRFMNIDPLAEKYAYQSPYNFSENRVIDSRELEGLEKVSIHLLGNISYNGKSNTIIANVNIDMGNKNKITYRLSIEGVGNIKGTYTQKEGLKYDVSEYKPDMKDAWASTMVKGIHIPDFIAKWGINDAKEDINPDNEKEALAMNKEQIEINETMNYILTSAYDFIDNDIMDAYYSLDGTLNGKFKNFTFSYDKFTFKGDGVIEYKEEEKIEEVKKEKITN
ncbi:MAG: hypothetical protein V4548_06710 [Bacteroidota bacterium]